MRILVVEDEFSLQQQICHQLEQIGYTVDRTHDGKEGLYLASEYPFDAAIIDIGLPGISGLEIIAALRKQGNLLPILILTAQGSWKDKVTGLEMGADDYLTKPFQMEELLARVKALLRRATGISDTVLTFGPLSLDLDAQSVHINNQSVNLTAFEYRVLELLIRNPEKTLSKQMIADYLYPHDEEQNSNVLEVIIGRLRRKLNAAGAIDWIETIRGRGYRFSPEKDA